MILAIIGIFVLLVLFLFVLKNRAASAPKEQEQKNTKIKTDWDYVWDMHCHILPGVDDGADSMQTALDMIWKEVREGVTDIMLTPHYIKGKTDTQLIKETYLELLHRVNEKEYPIRLYLGNEILFDMDTVRELQEGRALTLGGTTYVLVEFSTNIPFQKMKNDFIELQMAGYRPILAHLERFSCLRKREDRVEELVEQGVLMQVNTNSFTNDKTSDYVTSLAEHGLVHFIGTDSHSMDWRPPRMKGALRHLETCLSGKEMKGLLSENPYRLLKNKFI